MTEGLNTRFSKRNQDSWFYTHI